ncbi:MAG: LytR C-terminal domain-containing protein, partial [Calditrichaeota bacterium]|nr:LytR C-terminal domain-containing protein [Calditrichota bacterium]
ETIESNEQSTENTQSPQPVERGIQVEVLNGCGVSGLADRITKFLRKQDIDVVSTGNFDNFDVLTTRILDRSDNHERAEKVAEALGLSKDRILLRKDVNLQLDVTIVLGADYKSLEPLK